MRRPYIDSSDLAALRTLGLPGTGGGLRASDAERERAAEALRRHHADGRLTTEELEERTERAYAAMTHGELDSLFRDLPRLRTAQEERRPVRLWTWPPLLFAPLTAPLIALLITLAVITSAHVLWLVWPLMFFVFFRFVRPAFGWRSRGWPR